MIREKKFSRRRFLHGAAAAVAAPTVIPASALGKDGRTAPSDRIVMGYIGLGGQGTYNMNDFLGYSDVQGVAVCDVEKGSKFRRGNRLLGRDPAREKIESTYAEEARSGSYKGCASYGDFRELLARDDIDAVTVCTPDHWHGLISIAAARAGKDIYCEKPLTNSIAEGRAVCDAIKRYGRVLQTGSHERSTHAARFACELVRSGRIGKLHTIRVQMPNSDAHHREIIASQDPQPLMDPPASLDYNFWLGPTPLAPYTPMRSHFWWRFILAYGGGEMTDRGAHIIDLGQLGNATDNTGPIEYEGRGKANKNGLFDTFMEYRFEGRYANGVRLIGESEGPRGLKFEGSEGWIFINIHGCRLEAGPSSLLREVIGPEEVHLGRSPGHRRNFLDCVKSRKEPFATAEIGHRTATICHAFNIAMTLNRKLEWDPVGERFINDAEANRMISRSMRSPWCL